MLAEASAGRGFLSRLSPRAVLSLSNAPSRPAHFSSGNIAPSYTSDGAISASSLPGGWKVGNGLGDLRSNYPFALAAFHRSSTTSAAAKATGDISCDADQVVEPHPGLKKNVVYEQTEDYVMNHPVYEKEYVENVKPRHKVPQNMYHKLGYYAVYATRSTFDYLSGYGHGKMTQAKWLQRIIFLETVAGVPGMVAGMLRHMRSLRTMKRDNGWINTLLEESENERMHLLTFMELRQPGLMFRSMVLLAQGVFFNLFFLGYIVNPKICHAFVGYLEEEAVKTYTHLLQEIDEGKVWVDTPAPPIAINYWKMAPDANMRDLVLAVRADEACHAHVNHTFSDLQQDETNPFVSGKVQKLP